MVSYKKNLLLILFAVSLCIFAGCAKEETKILESDGLTEIVEKAEEEQYEKIVSQFSEVSISEISDILPELENDRLYFYFGRTTCLYCREFIIKNKEILIGLNEFYYVDTAKLDKDERELLETYKIEEIPAIIKTTYNKEMTLISINEFIKEIENET